MIRTITLLRYLSEPGLREQITAVTNRNEAFHGFADWLMFGGKLIGHNDPDYQEKVVKFNELIANCVIYSTACDITAANAIAAEGEPVDPADLATVSPYITHTVRRFGNWTLNLTPPEQAPVHQAGPGTEGLVRAAARGVGRGPAPAAPPPCWTGRPAVAAAFPVPVAPLAPRARRRASAGVPLGLRHRLKVTAAGSRPGRRRPFAAPPASPAGKPSGTFLVGKYCQGENMDDQIEPADAARALSEIGRGASR